ncbi:hypothetical protein EII38_09395 [Streptococcus minor]|uniref:DUF7365 domain-containing protein n=1 Tax=Streptococcus minor TaxID=229549 RepID=A0A3P1V672_9STRE|nr:hypothetical protein [Streptococcus minor]RRD29641.1 hypothetical protein EII38_09395 [Streptococcus minor]
MGEREFTHWLVTVLLPIGLGVLGAMAASKQNANKLEHRLTTLEVVNREQEKTIENQNNRLNKHDEEQKTMREMIVHIKNLSEDMRDFKADLKEIKEKIK